MTCADTYLWLIGFIADNGCHEYGNVVFTFSFEDTVRGSQEPDTTNF